MAKNIVGIQQIGIGIPDLKVAWDCYSKHFGMDIPVFQENAEAALMTKYTGGKVHSRSALLAINLQGGGGMEIWQFTSRGTEPPTFDIQLGDYGIFCTRINCLNVKDTFENYKRQGLDILGEVEKDPSGNEHFFVCDPYGMIYQVLKGEEWFNSGKHLTGGISGCIIGVSDIEKSLNLYRDILGFDEVVYDKTGAFKDFEKLPSGASETRRVLLKRSKKATGGFNELLCGSSNQIELVQVLNRQPKKIFENRFWGDQGFIHICFDVQDMASLKMECEAKGFPFTVDSANSFDMGEASGHFSYIEDPDGTLIEFVETTKIPIIKKLGWYLDVKKRDPKKALPKWMLNMMSLSRKKD